MRLDRLLGIVLELMVNQRVTAAELASKFEISVRTAYRDIDLINQAGIPVASFTGADGGFELMNGYFLTRQHFSLEDLSLIYSLLRNLEEAMGGTVTPAMRKLASLQPGVVKKEKRDAIFFDLNTTEPNRDIVQMLVQAVRQSHVIHLDYICAAGTSTERSVEPLNVLWEKGVWYLEGYCRLRRAKRYFRVSRMTHLDVSEETFVPRTIPGGLEQEETKGIIAHLRFDQSVHTRVFEQFPGQCTYQGDHIDVHTIFYKMEYAMSVIASYGSNVYIMSPDELREEVTLHIESIHRHYLKGKDEARPI
ncbi:helix-turn-helix transcriptional regulator [Paenibacillus favisporus]|uniref:helix-turn-helix transcriptional regulator n=1 Tax=Paenibacillus favisporus TaxID=221028 RepID=UPI0013D7C7D0|nr:YafY family protein [Paenibacillus favisporus]